MEVTYLGGASFALQGERSVVINPPAGRKADLAVYSQRQRKKLIVNGPGEYEIGGVLVVSAELPVTGGRTLAHAITLDDLRIVHLGQGAPSVEAGGLEALGRVDILLVDSENIPAAVDVAKALTPRVVVPFGAGAEAVCRGLGIEAKPEARLNWNGGGKVARAVLLKVPGTRRKAA